MLVKRARKVARQWVLEEGSKAPGFVGAFYHGSINFLPEDTVLPATSDVDVMVVRSDPSPPDKLGKFLYQDVLLEVSYIPNDRLRSPDMVLSDYHMAGSFRTPSIICDPHGQLAPLQAAVSHDFSRYEWVLRRCEHARSNVLNCLQSLDASHTFHEQVTTGLFAAGITTHILLVAGLKNPTVRRRYLAVRELLAEYGLLDFYETLLEILGCAQMRQRQVEQHLAALAEAFDAASAVIQTPYRFAADLTALARPVAIDGSRELIEQGFHREAVFWMVATYSRCQWVLAHDASGEMQERHSRGYHQLLGDLGVTSAADLQQRGQQIERTLPRIWDVAETILAANPEILHSAGKV